MSRDIYATPLLLGCTLYVLLRDLFPSIWIAGSQVFHDGRRQPNKRSKTALVFKSASE